MVSKAAKSSKIIQKIASKQIQDANKASIQTYDDYKRVVDIMGIVESAYGKRRVYDSSVASTLDFEINHHGVKSTATSVF